MSKSVVVTAVGIEGIRLSILSFWLPGVSSYKSSSKLGLTFSCPFLLTDGGDLCPSVLCRSLLLTDGKRVRGATGAGGENVRLLNGGGFFFGAALRLKGRSAEKSSDMLLDVGGVPSGLLLFTGLLKRLRGEGGGAVRHQEDSRLQGEHHRIPGEHAKGAGNKAIAFLTFRKGKALNLFRG